MRTTGIRTSRDRTSGGPPVVIKSTKNHKPAQMTKICPNLKLFFIRITDCFIQSAHRKTLLEQLCLWKKKKDIVVDTIETCHSMARSATPSQ